VVTTAGVVVGDFEGTASAQGFYLQDAAGDGDAATSDGIFVLTGSADVVSAGQVVRVTGIARERFSQTAIAGANNNTTPVPATSIVNCGSASVAATDVVLPFASADYAERFEGMLVRLPQALVIAEYYEPGAPANARTLANSLRRITLDDAVSAQNPSVLRHPNGDPFSLTNRFRGGDTVQNTIGVLGFDFSLYRIFPTGPADYAAVNARPASPEPVGGNLRISAMNTLNFFITPDYPTGNPLDNTCGPAQNVECRDGCHPRWPDLSAGQSGPDRRFPDPRLDRRSALHRYQEPPGAGANV
jgi:predicted extracellular nuclease